MVDYLNEVCELCGGISNTSPCLCVFKVKEERTAYTCPICSGRGLVDSMFYKIFHNGPVTCGTITNIQCEGCKGKGYVIG